MSGKSTYLRQVALCVVAAQVGGRLCFKCLRFSCQALLWPVQLPLLCDVLTSHPSYVWEFLLGLVALCIPPSLLLQVGAYVPAAFASLPPRDRLMARMGTGDSLETCSSSFFVEMQV